MRFGKAKVSFRHTIVVSLPLNKKSSRRTRNGKTSRKRFFARAYGVGEEVGEDVVLIVVLDSVFVEVAGEGFTTVVLLSVFFSAGGLTVSVFCSQAASKDAAPAKMQMYFFISCDRPILGHTNIRCKLVFRPCRHGIMSRLRKLQPVVKMRAQRVARGPRQQLEW